MKRAVLCSLLLVATCLVLGGLSPRAASAGNDGRIAFVARAGRGSGDGPQSFLHIPRAGESYVDVWDRYTFDIYTIAPDGSDLRRVTTDGTSRGPQWSWDGEWLAYVSGPRPLQSLYVVRADGSDREALLEREQGIDRYWWSLDSERLLVALSSRTSGRDGGVLEGQVIDVRTGDVARLSHGEWMRGWNHWAPNTDEVVNPRRRLMEALGHLQWPLWSPDAEFIAFVHDGLLALAHVPTVSGFGNWFVWNDEPFASGIIEWSRDGSRILFFGGGGIGSGSRDQNNIGPRGRTAMLVAEIDRKGYRWGSVHLVTTHEGGGGTFNGDGSRIAYLSTPPGRMNNELYVVDVTGDDQERITFSRVDHMELSWQPWPHANPDDATRALPDG